MPIKNTHHFIKNLGLFMVCLFLLASCQKIAPPFNDVESEGSTSVTSTSTETVTELSSETSSETTPSATPSETTSLEPTKPPTTTTTTTEPTTSPTTTTAATEQPSEAPSEPAQTAPPSGSAYANEPVLSDPKDPSYFKDAVFIGGSRTQGLMLYGSLYDADYVAGKGLDVADYFDQTIRINGQDISAAQYMTDRSGAYKDIYLSFGINELGWPVDNFISYYKNVIESVKAAHAGASIYLEAILPTDHSQDGSDYFSNANIKAFNARIAQLSLDEGVYFLDPTPALADQSGALPDGVSADGIHYDREYVEKWQYYIQTHVA
jgi:hypothetical protein